MTREEAMKELSYILDEMPSMECADWKEAISMAIEALEQPDALDKIRGEIKANRDDWIQGDIKWNIYDCCLHIIDKYRNK